MLFTLLVLPLVTFCFTLSSVVLQISKKVANLCLRFTEVSKVNMRAALLKNLRTPRGHFDAPHETLMKQSLESAVLIQRVFLKRRNKCWSMFIFICTSTLTNVPIHGRPFINPDYIFLSGNDRRSRSRRWWRSQPRRVSSNHEENKSLLRMTIPIRFLVRSLLPLFFSIFSMFFYDVFSCLIIYVWQCWMSYFVC